MSGVPKSGPRSSEFRSVDEKDREPLEEDKERTYYVLRSETPAEEIHLAPIACGPSFPDFVDHILLETVFEGKGPDMSEEELHTEKLQSESFLDNFEYWCGELNSPSAEKEGPLTARIQECLANTRRANVLRESSRADCTLMDSRIAVTLQRNVSSIG